MPGPAGADGTTQFFGGAEINSPDEEISRDAGPNTTLLMIGSAVVHSGGELVLQIDGSPAGTTAAAAAGVTTIPILFRATLPSGHHRVRLAARPGTQVNSISASTIFIANDPQPPRRRSVRP